MAFEMHALSHDAGDARDALTPAHIATACRRAFGESTRILAAHELGGGEYNTVYRIALQDHESVILRVAPLPGRSLPWHERALLRREHVAQPFFAPLASLTPRTLFADFTRQALPRDYLFQQDMPGIRWMDVERDLSPEEEATLWRDLAHIAGRIHAVEGDTFGQPWPGRQYPSWSATILDWLDLTADEMERAGVATGEVHDARALAAEYAPLLDEMRVPRLLHGDLWTFNVLIQRDLPAAPIVTAVLDCDRALWGDPFYEWTFHLLRRRASEHIRAAFFDTYGQPDPTPGQRFRQHIYEVMHLGNALADLNRRGRADDLIARVSGWLSAELADLRQEFSR